jgi:hypothetical protein
MPRVISRLLRQGLLLGAAIVLAPACQGELPAGPDELAAGIVIYENAGFEGGSAHLEGDVSDLRDFTGSCRHEHTECTVYCNTTYTYDWNDCISSIKVAPGWRATVYVDTGFHEDWLDVTADVSDLGQVRGYCNHDTWNDCISSIRVRRQ